VSEQSGGGAEPNTVASLVGELSTLSSLILGTDALDRVVWEAAVLAVRAIDEVDGCGVTVLRDGAPLSIMPGESDFAALENFQYEHGAGPIWQAMREHRTVVVTAHDAQGWPAYARCAGEAGVVTSVVMPLAAGDEVLGALSLYATSQVDLHGVRAHAEMVADLASTALSCMARHAQQVELTSELQTALESRAVIEQAKGMLMARGQSAEEAFATLRRASQNHNVKLRTVASMVVEMRAP
jgi:transcriptional regulator with GAF, ATPase, and Fis domain